jgi:electron transfer flavoprotein alpha subunit
VKIWIEKEQCNLCKICVKACVYNAIHWENEPVINDNCIYCGLCVQKCPKKAIILEGAESKNISLEGNYWIYMEQGPQGSSENSLEIISRLNNIRKNKDSKICCVSIGSEPNANEIEKIRLAGAEILYVLSSPALTSYQALSFTDILSAFCQKEKPLAFLFPASEKGRDLAPRLATVLQTGLTADCTELSIDDIGLLIQTRPAFSGDLMASIICPYFRPQMATVRAHSYKIEPATIQDTIEVHLLPVEISQQADSIGKCKILSRDAIVHEFDPVDQKKIVISIGRGIGSEEQVKSIIDFARSIDAGIGCSRPIVDKGWLPQSQQVGMSGKAVAPKLYIALGISGSVQHLSGIQSSEYILAVNHDENAPIFKIAHMGIVGDIKKLMPEIRKWVAAYIEKEKTTES